MHMNMQQDEMFIFLDFHVISVVQILIPFVVLVVLNCLIVQRLLGAEQARRAAVPAAPAPAEAELGRRQPSSFREFKRALGEARIAPAVRNAVHTTVVIVSSYLVCSGLHLVLTALERADSGLLKAADDPAKASLFYTLFGDLISFLYMFTSAIRILIYCKCSPPVRESILRTLSVYRPGFKLVELKNAPTDV